MLLRCESLEPPMLRWGHSHATSFPPICQARAVTVTQGSLKTIKLKNALPLSL
jgi:hypothetical protein